MNDCNSENEQVLSKRASQALEWLFGDEALSMNVGVARAAVVLRFGEDVDEELRALFVGKTKTQ